MATVVLGGALLSASLIFLNQAEPEAHWDSHRYRKTQICSTRRIGTIPAARSGRSRLPLTTHCLLLTLSIRPNGDLVFAQIRLEQYFFRAQISRLKELSG